MRGSDQIVYTLEVYTLLYSYISVKFVSLLIIARVTVQGVHCCSVGHEHSDTMKSQCKSKKCADGLFLLGALHCLVDWWAPGGPQHWLETIVMLFYFRMTTVKNTLDDCF